MPKSSPLNDPPRIALMGMPNVGKSTLFNCLTNTPTQRTRALTGRLEGLTRDVRHAAMQSLHNIPYTLTDTAGCPFHAKEDTLADHSWRHTQQCLQTSHAILFVLDGRYPMGGGDAHLLQWAREWARPTLIIANKCDHHARVPAISEWSDHDFAAPIAISCAHRRDLHLIHEWIADILPASSSPSTTTQKTSPFVVSIIGKPNVGKSTLANQLIGTESMLVSDIAHTTRDAIAHHLPIRLHDDAPCLLYDTAGLTRNKHSKQSLPQARRQTLQAISQSHLTLIMLDCREPPSKQDFAIADTAIQNLTTPLVVLNKCDLITATAKSHIQRQCRAIAANRMAQIGDVHIIAISAHNKRHVAQVKKHISAMRKKMARMCPTHALNRWLQHIVMQQPPPRGKSGVIKMRYITQTHHSPPQFTLFVNRPREVQESYKRYVMHQLRRFLHCDGIAMRLIWRKSMKRWNERVTNERLGTERVTNERLTS